MVDLKRRKFVLNSLKFTASSAAVLATVPVTNLYQEKVEPVLREKFPEKNFPSAKKNFDFNNQNLLQKMMPHLIMSSTIYSLLLIYSDQIEIFAIVLIAALSMLLLGIPVTEATLNLFI